MSDDQTITPAVSATDPVAQVIDPVAADDPGARSPLDILEELLKKNQGAGANDGEVAAADPAAATATDDAAAAAAEAAEKERIALAMAAKEAEEAILVEQKLTELKNVTETPQEQERLRQVQEQQQAKTDSTSGQDGFVIHQLGHTKI